MILKEIKNLFNKELSDIYTPSEIQELFFILSEKFLGGDKITIRRNENIDIEEFKEKKIFSALSELKSGKPYQQILGEALFYGNTFFVDENVLIPRPETEELIEIIVKQLHLQKHENLKILDIGTGSGCIPITLAKYFPNAQITSIDISEKALKIARKNADFHQVKINFVQKDYLIEKLNDEYDIIVSNPPYISTSESEEIPFSVKNFEPNIALFAPQNRDLAFYEKIASDCENHLKKNGYIFLEINQKLGQETLQLFKTKFRNTQLLKDISGNDRFVIKSK
ncbi:MAG: peptide chain release factor N(5)-glutamine methyltransferase [Flavobacteriaceae bacterium]|nr:peptide chain release factor N(5)-glutamine methyltransferase [Flavobacteriaceae bacterium]